MPELQVLGQHVSLLEALAFVTGLACVWFVLRMNILTWPTGIVSVCCYAFVFLDVKLYADATLQLAFFAASVYGWREWKSAGTRAEGAHRVLACSRTERVLTLAAALVTTAVTAIALARLTDSPAPAADASVFAFSLLATVLQARQRIEGWWYWILVDVVSLPLYWSRALYLTAVLYLVFLIMAIAGLRAWRARLASQRS